MKELYWRIQELRDRLEELAWGGEDEFRRLSDEELTHALPEELCSRREVLRAMELAQAQPVLLGEERAVRKPLVIAA